jgi:DNA-binding ferritin-like protein
LGTDDNNMSNGFISKIKVPSIFMNHGEFTAENIANNLNGLIPNAEAIAADPMAALSSIKNVVTSLFDANPAMKQMMSNVIPGFENMYEQLQNNFGIAENVEDEEEAENAENAAADVEEFEVEEVD